MPYSSTPAPLRLGPYELLRRIATGGMAEVYLARRAGPHGFQKIVAVKRILPQFAEDSDFVAMFVDEARVCARLSHPHIVSVFDFGEQDGELYMAMEYVDGTTGARLIRAAAAHGEAVPLEVSLHIALSVLRALEYAHSARDDAGQHLKLVHRDVSPGNILIDRSGAVKLTDFGIARAVEIERRTDAGQLKGKLGYMSPEQVVGRELDPRSDLFTLGIVLAELVILRPLFSGGRELDVLMRIRDADLTAIDRATERVPDDVRAVLFRALAKEPYLRYPSAAHFSSAIEELVRRRRLQTGPSRLAAYIEKLGLVQGPDIEEETGDPSAPRTSRVSLPPASARPLRSDPPRTFPPPGGAKEVAPNVYRLSLAGGAVVGPMSYPRVIELFATGRANPDTLVAREEGPFRPASECSELSRFVSSPALRWDDGLAQGAEERGPLVRARFPTTLFHLALKRETGVLMLAQAEKRKKIYLVDGVPDFVASTEKSELLGEYLIRRGQVLRMEIDMALAMLPRFGGRIGDALVGLGVLRPVELFRAIHDQTEERCVEVFQWREGTVAFVRGARSQEETFPLGVDPFELIGRGVRTGYTADELSLLLQEVEEEVIEPVMVPPIRPEMFRLPDKELRVLELANKKTTLSKLLGEVTAKGVADPEEVLRTVFLGLCCELLRSPKWVVPTSYKPLWADQ